MYVRNVLIQIKEVITKLSFTEGIRHQSCVNEPVVISHLIQIIDLI